MDNLDLSELCGIRGEFLDFIRVNSRAFAVTIRVHSRLD
jgi:hypothetical protein